MDTSYAKADSYATPDSNPWGQGGVPDKPVAPYGITKEGGWYDDRDDMVGGTDNQWTMQDSDQQSGAAWRSYGDTAPVVNSGSGVGGDRARFSGTLSQADLAS